MERDTNAQAKHDAKVKEMAQELEKQGFHVKADIEGYEQPGTIRGLRPDIMATKGRDTRIIEVETEDTLKSERDQAQQEAFRQEADENKHTTFKKRVARD